MSRRSIGSRIARLEKAHPNDSASVVRVATKGHVEIARTEAKARGEAPPLCFITGEDQDPPIIVEQTIDEFLRQIAEHNRPIHEADEIEPPDLPEMKFE